MSFGVPEDHSDLTGLSALQFLCSSPLFQTIDQPAFFSTDKSGKPDLRILAK